MEISRQRIVIQTYNKPVCFYSKATDVEARKRYTFLFLELKQPQKTKIFLLASPSVASSQIEKLVCKFQAWLFMDALADQKRQLVGILTRCWHSD